MTGYSAGLLARWLALLPDSGTPVLLRVDTPGCGCRGCRAVRAGYGVPRGGVMAGTDGGRHRTPDRRLPRRLNGEQVAWLILAGTALAGMAVVWWAIHRVM